jgi:hypothetical protein
MAIGSLAFGGNFMDSFQLTKEYKNYREVFPKRS